MPRFKIADDVLERIRADIQWIDDAAKRPHEGFASIKEKFMAKEEKPEPKPEPKPEHFGPCPACQGSGLDVSDASKLCTGCGGSGQVLIAQ